MKSDKKRAIRYLRIAAEDGLADAMYQLGWHYYSGTFIRKNIAKSIGDAHGKNFSILYRGGTPRLTPVYDSLCTTVYPSIAKKMAMKFQTDANTYCFKPAMVNLTLSGCMSATWMANGCFTMSITKCGRGDMADDWISPTGRFASFAGKSHFGL